MKSKFKKISTIVGGVLLASAVAVPTAAVIVSCSSDTPAPQPTKIEINEPKVSELFGGVQEQINASKNTTEQALKSSISSSIDSILGINNGVSSVEILFDKPLNETPSNTIARIKKITIHFNSEKVKLSSHQSSNQNYDFTSSENKIEINYKTPISSQIFGTNNKQLVYNNSLAQSFKEYLNKKIIAENKSIDNLKDIIRIDINSKYPNAITDSSKIEITVENNPSDLTTDQKVVVTSISLNFNDQVLSFINGDSKETDIQLINPTKITYNPKAPNNQTNISGTINPSKVIDLDKMKLEKIFTKVSEAMKETADSSMLLSNIETKVKTLAPEPGLDFISNVNSSNGIEVVYSYSKDVISIDAKAKLAEVKINFTFSDGKILKAQTLNTNDYNIDIKSNYIKFVDMKNGTETTGISGTLANVDSLDILTVQGNIQNLTTMLTNWSKQFVTNYFNFYVSSQGIVELSKILKIPADYIQNVQVKASDSWINDYTNIPVNLSIIFTKYLTQNTQNPDAVGHVTYYHYGQNSSFAKPSLIVLNIESGKAPELDFFNNFLSSIDVQRKFYDTMIKFYNDTKNTEFPGAGGYNWFNPESPDISYEGFHDGLFSQIGDSYPEPYKQFEAQIKNLFVDVDPTLITGIGGLAYKNDKGGYSLSFLVAFKAIYGNLNQLQPVNYDNSKMIIRKYASTPGFADYNTVLQFCIPSVEFPEPVAPPEY